MATPGLTVAAHRRVQIRAAIAVVLALPVLAAAIVLTDAGGVALLVPFGVAGLVLAVRRPGQPIAWLLLLMAIGLGLGTTRVVATADELLGGTATAIGEFTAWANGIGWVIVFAGLAGIALVFPNGTLPTGRWRTVARAVAVAFVPISVLLVFGPTINVTAPGYPNGLDVANPYALPLLAGIELGSSTQVLWPTMFVLSFVAMVSLFDRFRRSTGLARLQYRWLAWALALVAVASLVWAVLTTVIRIDVPFVAAAVVLVSYPTIPFAILVAVLRYRLYEIDRIISRTLGWGLATATVAAVFVVAVLALQAALVDVTQAETLAVAASTLLAFAVFQPVRTRVQAFVDRRFDRPRLEAERSLAAYGERLQHEVDLPTVTRDVEETVVAALRPSAAALWIRPSRQARP